MTTILVIKSSANGAASISNRLIDQLIERLRQAMPPLEVIERDLDRTPIMHLHSETLAAVGRAAVDTDAAKPVRDLSDKAIAEVFAADMIVIGAPMYNLGISSTLKSWFDHIMRPRSTFAYGPDGLKGLVPPKPVIVIQTRGSIYSAGSMAASDHQEPHLRAMLAFIGLTDPHFVRVEGLAIGDAEQIFAEASSRLNRHCLAELGKVA